MDAVSRIKDLLERHRAVLFMRGSPSRPMCRASALASAALESVSADYHVIDVQSDPEIRAYLPKYSDQKGFPQFFLHGEFIGGADIVNELNQQGELEAMVQPEDPVTAMAS